MNNSAHKTSYAEFSEWRGDVSRNGIKRLPSSRKKVSAKELSELWDEEIPFGTREDRETNNIPSLDQTSAKLLDEMITRDGLARVLKTIRELCESRAPSEFDCGSTFADVAGGEEWLEHAQHIEEVLRKLK